MYFRSVEEHQLYYIYAISCLQYYALGTIFPPPTNLWVLLPGNGTYDPGMIHPLTIDTAGKIKRIVQEMGCFGLLDSDGNSVDSQLYRIRVLDPHSVDFAILKEWLTFCEENHNSPCETVSLELPHSFTVIDCETKTIGDLPHGSEFLALSYVWGVPTPTLTVVTINAESELPEHVPLVIQDAITVRKSLGFDIYG